MSGNTLAGGDKTTTITVRVDENLKERYRTEVDSMSGDIEEYIREKVNSEPDGYDTPLIPPTEPRLARGYRKLCAAATSNGNVRDDTACRIVSGGPENIAKSEAKDLVLKQLHRRGYIRPTGSPYTSESYWKLNHWEARDE
ncbi:hypothetical protein [Halobacterium sp. KA-6]|uniref:hypothetical protein n=1 Tax=Halobacterium sp. KA-6 TaxID=2896368 RepID=UPI001E3ED9A8|nr:hypothetical protein [Halobacterium sp. KA-6]MCD2202760.1 hypothetical protein [Halobacterium sp. KA-6]